MKKSLLLIALFVATVFPSFAQVEMEIQQSKMEKIEKGRAYMLEKFLERDYEKMREIKDYLLQLEDDNYYSFTPGELSLILFWTRDFDELTTLLGSDSTYFDSFKDKVGPKYDYMYPQLYRRSVEDKHVLSSSIEEANLAAKDKDFLTIYLDWSLEPLYNRNNKSYNERIDKYLADNPDSRYKWIAKNLIRQPYYEVSDWGWGFSLELCSGFATGDMPQPIFGLGLCFEIVYKRFELALGYDIMSGNTRFAQSFSNDSIYPKGSHVNCLPFYAVLSYNVIDNNSIRVAPALGIGGNIEAYPKKKHPGTESLDKCHIMLEGGFVFDFKINRGRNSVENNYIRIRYNCGITGFGKEISTLHVISLNWTGIVLGRRLVDK